ncbi:rubredoxin [Thiocapsa sp.]|uniref:rubredoxin n=1 Tax=Thiocapsa sp. TaxID=2024551 RepID=UPI003593C8F4
MNRGADADGPDASDLGAIPRNGDSRMECRIGWYLYVPAAGDPVAQVPPETAFDHLPDDWRCPRCERQILFPARHVGRISAA